MSEITSWLIPLVAVLLGSSGVAGSFVLLRREARQAPVEWQTAQVANAAALSHAAQGLVSMVNAQLKVQDSKIDSQDSKIDSQDILIEALRTDNSGLRLEVNELQAGAKVMVDHVSAVHDWIESGAQPPPPERPHWAPRSAVTPTSAT
jgi:hypothetical protein